MTLRELSVDLQNIVRGGKVSDDENISLRQIQFWIHNTRAMLISQEIGKKRTISENIKQDLGCLDVSLVDASACCNIQVDCEVLRTDVQIPNAIETANKDLVTRIGPADLTAPAYTFIPYERAAYSGRGKYTKLQNFAFIHDNYVYIMGPQASMFSRINVQGVFENPTEVASFKNCVGVACYTDESEYPISAKHVEMMKRMILETNFRIATAAPTDVSGDSKSNVEQNIEN